jgi:hypothetical protein
MATRSVLTAYTVRPPTAKRRKLERAGNASSSKSPAKTKRTGFSRRVRGRLQNMLSLPFDVLFSVRPFRRNIVFPSVPEQDTTPQVFSELGPMDLVNLARTSKALRQVLMSRASLSVWLVARRNAGITKVPDPPEDMSEPSWALLLFGPAVCSVRSRPFLLINFELSLGHSTVLRRTFTESTSAFVVACASPVGRESNKHFSSDSSDSDREIHRSFVSSSRFQYQCPDLKESVMSHLPYTNRAISFSSLSSCRLLTRHLPSWGMGMRPRHRWSFLLETRFVRDEQENSRTRGGERCGKARSAAEAQSLSSRKNYGSNLYRRSELTFRRPHTFNDSSNRVAPNSRNGQGWKHEHRLKLLTKREPRGTTREY